MHGAKLQLNKSLFDSTWKTQIISAKRDYTFNDVINGFEYAAADWVVQKLRHR